MRITVTILLLLAAACVRRIPAPDWCVEECRAIHGGAPIPNEARCRGGAQDPCNCTCATERCLDRCGGNAKCLDACD